MSRHFRQRYVVSDERCTGCAGCAALCPTLAITVVVRTSYGPADHSSATLAHISASCVGCGDCARFCPVGAIVPLNSEATGRV